LSIFSRLTETGNLKLTQHPIRPITLKKSEMITESITIQGSAVNSLAVTPTELLKSSMHFLNTASTAEARLTTLALIALTVSITLLLWVIARQRHTHHLHKKITELTATNKMLRKEVCELQREQVDILEEIIEAEPPKKQIPGFNPQELKALAELARRLS
jgi:hypothetical protein